MILRDVSVKDFIDEQLTHNAFEPAGYLGAEPLDTNAPDTDDGSRVEPPTTEESMVTFLRNTPHLYSVPASELRYMASETLRREYGYLDTILDFNNEIDHVFVVLFGSVEVFAEQANGSCERVGSVATGDLFGYDAIIFEESSEFRYVAAGSRKTCIGMIPKRLFLDLLERHVIVAQSVGRKLAEHMDTFLCFKEFCRHVFSHEAAKNEYLPLWTIVDSYTRLNNVIHSKMKSSELDTGAWGYASKRLPENLTTTFCFDLVRGLPPFVASRMRTMSRNVDKNNKENVRSFGDLKYVATKERRRCSWQLGMEGKTLVLLRDGFTDILDFITCLCIHIIESNKLRARLQGMVHPPAIDVLDEILHPSDDASPLTGDSRTARTKEILASMPLTQNEQAGLLRLWPNDCLQRIYEILMHREEFMLRVDASISRSFQTDPFHEWALNLRAEVMKKCGLPSTSPLPSDLVIDIISSNTHCTKNLLGPFARKYRVDILALAEEKKFSRAGWVNEEDFVYFASVTFLAAHPELQQEYTDMLKMANITVMEDTAMTGLQVDIIPLSKLDPSMIDPILAESLQDGSHCFGQRHFILNMDFAFGAQAEGIIKTLIATFATAIRSINVMGKAGGLTGSRGDIQIASNVLLSKSSLTTEDFQDELRSCGNEDITVKRLRELIGPHVGIHHGTVLTIPGTMLQNVKLLRFYKRVWKCVGVEMEGSYFARMIHEMRKADIVSPNLKTRFLYYTSDLPLASASDTNLATPMRPNEGVPPLYAVARAILEQILNSDSCGPRW